MNAEVLEVTALPAFRLRLRFVDGATGELDVFDLVPREGCFAPLADPEYFARVRVNPESGTVQWPNGADIDPAVLRANIH